MNRNFLQSFADVLGVVYAGVVLALVLTLAIWGVAGAPGDFDNLYAPDGTQANQWHGNIGTVGGGAGGGSNANPNDNAGGIHNIAGIKGENRAGGQGAVPACTAHGGFNGVKKNC